MKIQAERCSKAHAAIHAERQRNLGERMIGHTDKPRRIEVFVTAIIVIAAFFAAIH